ncbi:MAG: hypothetical protein SF182_25790 [Deltaproteobacteria bacterium]|nr:hypothetical protein [Deltaproteobacteria bacterium]
MQRIAQSFEGVEETDELVNDRLPGMPLLGFLTGTVLSLALWAGLAVLAWAS